MCILVPEHNGASQEKNVGAGRAPPIISKHSECSKFATVCCEQVSPSSCCFNLCLCTAGQHKKSCE